MYVWDRIIVVQLVISYLSEKLVQSHQLAKFYIFSSSVRTEVAIEVGKVAGVLFFKPALLKNEQGLVTAFSD